MQNENQNQVGGPYLIQDSDHMVQPNQSSGKAKRGNRQVDQGQTSGRQQGGSDHGAPRQQGGEQGKRRH